MNEQQRQMAERIIQRWIEKPELLDQLLQSLQEEPVLWEEEDSTPPNSPSDTGPKDQKPE
jgi:hypothetical protein